jgi:hypothetical protein
MSQNINWISKTIDLSSKVFYETDNFYSHKRQALLCTSLTTNTFVISPSSNDIGFKVSS